MPLLIKLFRYSDVSGLTCFMFRIPVVCAHCMRVSGLTCFFTYQNKCFSSLHDIVYFFST